MHLKYSNFRENKSKKYCPTFLIRINLSQSSWLPGGVEVLMEVATGIFCHEVVVPAGPQMELDSRPSLWCDHFLESEELPQDDHSLWPHT